MVLLGPQPHKKRGALCYISGSLPTEKRGTNKGVLCLSCAQEGVDGARYVIPIK